MNELTTCHICLVQFAHGLEGRIDNVDVLIGGRHGKGAGGVVEHIDDGGVAIVGIFARPGGAERSDLDGKDKLVESGWHVVARRRSRHVRIRTYRCDYDINRSTRPGQFGGRVPIFHVLLLILALGNIVRRNEGGVLRRLSGEVSAVSVCNLLRHGLAGELES